MMRIFSAIRKRLLSLGAIGKYLAYGGGEIILTVIGILIALQVNNWNIDQKNRKSEIKYVKGLLEEVQQDIAELQEVITLDTIQINTVNFLLNGIKHNRLKNDHTEVGLWAQLAIVNDFNHHNIIMEDMKSSGRISLLATDSIRLQVLEYYDFCQSTEEAEDTNNELILQWYMNYWVETDSDINSTTKTILPGLVEIDPYNPSPMTPRRKREVIDRLTLKYSLTSVNLLRYFQALEKALQLKKNLNTYLAELA